MSTACHVFQRLFHRLFHRLHQLLIQNIPAERGALFRNHLVRLIRTLQEEGFEVWVYTSSYRPVQYIRALFAFYGIRFDEIINSPRHLKEVQKNHTSPLPQKMPGHYRISLHIDDEDVIHEYGRRLGFRTFKVCDPDPVWADKVLAEARRIRKIEEASGKSEHRLPRRPRLWRLF